MSKKKSRRTAAVPRRGRKSLFVAGVLLALLASGGALAHWGAPWTAQKERRRPPAPTVAPDSSTNITAASLSKEYVYAGGRLVATEEPNALAPTSQSFAANGGSGSVTVTVAAGVGWTTVNNAPSWITVTAGSSGTGPGTVTYPVTATTTGSIRNGTLTIAGQTFTVYQGKDFDDVLSSHPYYTYIGRLAARQVTLGCSATPPLYCPGQTVLREQMAAFIIRALGMPNPPTPTTQRFADVPIDGSNGFYKFIEQMAVRGITNGCGTNGQGQPIYCPADPVTHGQMATFISRALGAFDPPAPGQATFCDVATTHTFFKFIEFYAGGAGGRPVIWPGCGGVTPTNCGSIGVSNCTSSSRCFCPDAPVTRAEMAYILVKAFNL